MRPTGLEFTHSDELTREKERAVYRKDKATLLLILLEEQRRRWSDETRQALGLQERYYLIKGHSLYHCGGTCEHRKESP